MGRRAPARTRQDRRPGQPSKSASPPPTANGVTPSSRSYIADIPHPPPPPSSNLTRFGLGKHRKHYKRAPQRHGRNRLCAVSANAEHPGITHNPPSSRPLNRTYKASHHTFVHKKPTIYLTNTITTPASAPKSTPAAKNGCLQVLARVTEQEAVGRPPIPSPSSVSIADKHRRESVQRVRGWQALVDWREQGSEPRRRSSEEVGKGHGNPEVVAPAIISCKRHNTGHSYRGARRTATSTRESSE